MQELKERGIYTLPSEPGELVAHAVFRGGYVLYTPTDWEFFGPYIYDSDRAGNIRREGQFRSLPRVMSLTLFSD
jgi:hypothetical protein